MREENVLIKTHFDKKLKEVEYLQNENTKLKSSIKCKQLETNIKQNQSVETVNDFEITVPTQNRFSMLEETSHKEEARVQEQLNVQSKQIDDNSKTKQTNLQHPKLVSKDEHDLNCVLNISPLFHRIGQRQFNLKVDEINKKLSTLIGKNLQIMTNRHITFRERHLFEPDGVHFNRNVTIELAVKTDSFIKNVGVNKN